MWMQYDEAHISTLAVAPEFRKRGIGGLVLLHLIDEALERAADIVTLEVRRSNEAAQRLYARFGLVLAGERRAYYTDTGEDALIMTTPPVGSVDWQARYARVRASVLARERDEQQER
jgi:ribosomal-protein-alanine N-acetyltransferase